MSAYGVDLSSLGQRPMMNTTTELRVPQVGWGGGGFLRRLSDISFSKTLLAV